MNPDEVEVDENIRALSDNPTVENVQYLKSRLSVAWLNNASMRRMLADNRNRIPTLERRVADLETTLRVVLSLQGA
jgi:hypothetical protein